MKRSITFLFLIIAVNNVWCQFTHEFIPGPQILENSTALAQDVSIGPDGTVFLANGSDGLRAFIFDGSTYSLSAHIYDGGDAMDVEVDSDGLILLANGSDGLRAYSYDGTSLTNIAHINEGGIARGLSIGQDSLIYVANSMGVIAYNWDSSDFSFIASRNDGGDAMDIDVGSDGTILLANGDDGLRAYSFNGSTFSLVEHIDIGGSGYTKGVKAGPEGTFFLANGSDGLFAYHYLGMNFTLSALVDDEGFAEGVAVGSDGTIFLANGADGLRAYNYDGSALALTSHINSGGEAISAAIGSGGTIFLANGNDGLRTYLYSELNVVGPIVVNEILQNPSIVGDSEGEWFEVYNPNSTIVHLENWSIEDNGSDSFIITEPLIVPASSFLVFGINADSNTNGNVVIDYQYSGFTLGNSSDEIIIKNAQGLTVDSVAWDGSPNFPDPSGASMALLDPTLDNSIGSNWAESSTAFGLGDFGTPGLPNFLSNIVIDPIVLEFDTVFVAESGVLSLTISNDGNAPLLIDSIYTTSPLFEVSFTDSLIETTADLQITFTPAEFGEVSDILYISSNDPDDGLMEIPLSGFGYYLSPDIELESTSIDFGGVMDGLTSVEVFHIYNMGAGVLELDSVYCTENFTVSETDGSVAPGESLALEVSFSPDDEIAFAGVLTIVAGNDPDEDILTVSLTGFGVAQAPIMTLSETDLYFGVVIPNQTVARQLTIYNEGMLDLEIEELTMSGSELFTTTFSDASIVPGDSVVVEFQFLSVDMISQVVGIATVVAAAVNNVNVQLSAGYFGPVWYVSVDGDDVNGIGSLENPFATIQHGIDNMMDSDSLIVVPGTYHENIIFSGNNKVVGSTYLVNLDPSFISSTIIDGSQNGTVVTFDDASGELYGFTIRNGNGTFGGGIHCEGSSPKLSHLNIENNSAYEGGGLWLKNSNANISDLVIRNNDGGNGGGIRCEGAFPTIINTIIFSNTSQYGAGLYCYPDSDPQFINVTFSDNGPRGLYLNNTYATLINCIVVESQIEIGGGEPGITYLNAQYSNIQGGWPGVNNIDADPQFCDPANGDYHLTETSPCIGSGLDGASMGAFGVGCESITPIPIWHVSTIGSDETGTGSEENPYATIQHSINLASDRDTILVHQGVYNERISFEGKNLYVTSELFMNPDSLVLIDQTIIDGSGLDSSVVDFSGGEDSSAVLRGFSITNGSAQYGGGIHCQSDPTLMSLNILGNVATAGGGIYCTGSPTLLNLDIHDNHAQGGDDNVGDGGGGIYFEGSAAELINVRVTNNSTGFGGIYPGGGGIYLQAGSSPSITGSLIANNVGHGIFSIYGSSPNISHSAIVFNDGEAVFMEYGGNLDISSSIIWGNTSEYQLYTESADAAIISYSDVHGGWEGMGNIGVDPRFCDPGEGNYWLAETSPCIGSGIDGSDMGAYGLGCAAPVAIETITLPTEFSLKQNYPNPFNPSTTIRYGLPEAANVSLVIYDVRGQVVQTLESAHQSAGWYDVIWNGQTADGKTISTGIYFARLVAGDYSQVVKMLYLK